MKVLLSYFHLESNERVGGLTELDRFNIKFGEELLNSMYVKDIFEDNGFEMIPGVYANAHAGTVLSREAFQYISDKMINAIAENLEALDGIFLFMHGGSKVDKLPGGSGERYILNEIRRVTGPYLPIFVVMDPHGNLTDTYVANMTYGRSYRESPHTDIVETFRHVAYDMVAYLNNKRHIVPVYRKLPFVLGGEKSVSTDEPMISINRKLDEIEKDSRILSASFHVGYIRHDNYGVGSGLIVVPSDSIHTEYANEVIDELYDFCVSRYQDFHYHGNALEVNSAIKASIELKYQHIVMSDSGDNVTAGASGKNTDLLRQYININDYNQKKILFSGITDDVLFHQIKDCEIGSKHRVSIGRGESALSKPIEIEVEVMQQGELQQIFGDKDNYGSTITLSLVDKPIDIVLIEKSVSFAEMHQYQAAKIDLNEYDLVIVKQGYIFPELVDYADHTIMALTDGATNQRTEKIVFKQIKRPMMPFDSLEDIEREGKE